MPASEEFADLAQRVLTCAQDLHVSIAAADFDAEERGRLGLDAAPAAETLPKRLAALETAVQLMLTEFRPASRAPRSGRSQRQMSAIRDPSWQRS